MKPTNAEEPGCSPISSRCVIWDGPDLPCIKLCKGDTISIVVYKMAVELCALIEMFKISNYDLTCLNLGNCPPKDFQALIQLLIARICALENISPPTPGSGTGCPDCIVNIAPCFYFQNPQGDTVTTMQLADYVIAIGNRMCLLVDQINTINQILANHETRIQILENATPPTYTPPTVTPICVLPSSPTQMDVLLAALEQQFCELRNATGMPMDIFVAIANQCAGLNSANQLAGGGIMSSIPGWNSTVSNSAQTLTNIWLTICDMRAAIRNIQLNCCNDTCDGVDVNVTAELLNPTTLKLFFSGSVPLGFTECNPAGSTVTIADQSGGSITITVPVQANLNNATGYTVDLTATPINGAENLVITTTLCFTDPSTGTTCQKEVTYILINTAICPDLNLNIATNQIDYQFGWTGGAAQFTIQLYDAAGVVLLQSQSTSLGGPGSVNNSFVGLTAGTTYRIRIMITIGTVVTTCPFYLATTLNLACTPPTNVTANIILS